MSVLVVTSLGDIVVDLHTDRCPLTTKNFLKLCKMKYYNGCLFHKVEKDFMAQTGDRTGTGSGGDSVYKFLYGDQARFFDDEIHPDLKHSKTGTVAMATAGKNCNASQFYFTLRDDLDYLDGKNTVFGIVEEQEGLDTLAKINETFVDDKGRPYKNIRIKHTYILDDPFSDPAQLGEFIPEKSPEGKPGDETAEERLEDNWVPIEENLGAAELEEALRAKEAHTNAAILESIGDIPDADIKPPENVLFVCKLNPVTQDEDLHTIFSRFGNVVSADIIRDFKTGDSLCYAFIEFETQEACELAYFKMDNTLIDDRRIHVDFSQSVSKLWSQYKHGKRSQNKGNCCFKCGAPDHIAKDCDQETGKKQEAPKYILKEVNEQRGGDQQSYEMVFEGDAPRSGGSGDEAKNTRKKHKVDYHYHEEPKHKNYDSRELDSRSNKHKHDQRSGVCRESVGAQASGSSEHHRDRGKPHSGRDADIHEGDKKPQQCDSSRSSKAFREQRDSVLKQDEQKRYKSMDRDVGKKEKTDHFINWHGRDGENGRRKDLADSIIDHKMISGEKDADRDNDRELSKQHESERYSRDNREPRQSSSDRHRHDERESQGDKIDRHNSRHGRDGRVLVKRDEGRDKSHRHERRHRAERR